MASKEYTNVELHTDITNQYTKGKTLYHNLINLKNDSPDYFDNIQDILQSLRDISIKCPLTKHILINFDYNILNKNSTFEGDINAFKLKVLQNTNLLIDMRHNLDLPMSHQIDLSIAESYIMIGSLACFDKPGSLDNLEYFNMADLYYKKPLSSYYKSIYYLLFGNLETACKNFLTHFDEAIKRGIQKEINIPEDIFEAYNQLSFYFERQKDKVVIRELNIIRT